jgi:hypothetical protein
MQLMKNALVVVAAVLGYCLVEVVALISAPTPSYTLNSLPTKMVVFYWAQVLLIPGAGILFSRFIYGAHRWRTRAISSLLIGSLGIPSALVLVGLIMATLSGWIDERVSLALRFALSAASQGTENGNCGVRQSWRHRGFQWLQF